MPQAILIQTNGKVSKIKIENLTDMQTAVDGYIELLPVQSNKYGVSVYCNEEGRLRELPINMGACLWLIHNDMYPALEMPVHGDVLVLGKSNDEGEDTDVPDEVEVRSLWVEPSFEFVSMDKESMEDWMENQSNLHKKRINGESTE